MKQYIRDDNGRIKNCPANISKMNIFEYLYFDLFHNKILIQCLIETLEQYGIVFKEIYCALSLTFILVFSPFILPFKAYKVIKEAKKRLNK